MTRLRLCRALISAAALLVVLVTLAGGEVNQGYSHIRHFVSELGAAGMVGAAVVNFGGFLPIGGLVLTFLTLGRRLLDIDRVGLVGYSLLATIGVAYLGAAVAPCDPGCPATGPLRQQIHNLLGVLEYLAGGIGLILLARGLRSAGGSVRLSASLAAAGTLVLLALVGLAAPRIAVWRGLLQRVAETLLFGSLVTIGWRVMREGERRRWDMW